jgi:bifunctional aspartokinase / homoserine dehydrogenase 1
LAEKTLAVAVIGVGNVGAELLEQMRLAQAALLREEGVVIAVCGIMNSSKLLLADAPINLETWREQLSASQVPADVDQFIENFNANQYPNAVVIDCTANSMIAGRYADFIQNNLHVITPNKKAGSGDYDYYQFLKQVSKKHQRYFLYETTVCAALPVIHTLKDLLRTGDEVRNIRAVVSGSLSFIFNQVSRGCCFSDSVKQAHQSGYTEPDPREDLSGMDIARKMVCLAREMGHPATLDEIDGLNLVPKELQGVSKEEFLAQLHHYDEAMAVKINQLKQGFDKLACVGEISDSGTIKVKLNAVKNSDPLATLEQTDNMVVFTTERYREQPLVIRGPGAGAAVTASGVFSDLLRLITYIRT